jgi:hypothetical protein
MQKSLAESEAAKPGCVRGTRQLRRIVCAERDIEGERLVHRERRATDARIVQRAAMTGIDDERRIHCAPQVFEGIERLRPDADFSATSAGDLV